MNTEQLTGGPTAGESADQLIASVLVAMAGTAMFNLSPLYLAAAAAEHGFTDHQLGFLMSLEVAGIALASLLVLILIDRVETRRVLPDSRGTRRECGNPDFIRRARG